MPSRFKHLGPGTAVREMSITRIQEYDDDSDDCGKPQPPPPPPLPPDTSDKNLNDVCFGCDGSCGDRSCSSKHAAAARMISSSDYSPGTSPSQMGGGIGQSYLEQDFESVQQNAADSNSNMDHDLVATADSDHNGNSQSNSPVKTPSPKSIRALQSPKKSPKSPRNRGKKFKRLRSSSEAPEDSPNKRVINGGGSLDSLEDNGNEGQHYSSEEYDDEQGDVDPEQQAVVDEMR